MKLSKTTINMAKRRDIALVENTVSVQDIQTRKYQRYQVIEITRFDSDGEPWDEYQASYRITDEGLFFDGGCFGNTEDWPNWIKDDKALRSMLDSMDQEMIR